MKEVVVYNPENELDKDSFEENDKSDHNSPEHNFLKYITYNGKVYIIVFYA